MTKCGLDKDISLESLHERLRNLGIKVTQQRSQVLNMLLNQPGPVSADEVFKWFSVNLVPMDLVTIYRILKKFEDVFIVSRQEFGDGVSRFELITGSGHHHHHVICRMCQKVEPLHLCNLDTHVKIVEKMGYGQVSHRLDFFGICTSCQ